MLSAALLVQALLVSVALATPASKARLSNRLERRASRRGGPLRKSENLVRNQTNAEYSENWSGAVYDSYPSGTFSGVVGTFTVPTPSEPSGSSGSHSASAWVGIDGDTCDSAIWQTGIDFTIDGGSVSYDAWYEWYPAYADDFSGITFSAGDEVKLTITVTSTTSGTAVIDNVTKGKSVSKSISSSSALCKENAEWIVEDYEEGDSLVPLANWGTVTFSSASATTTSGSIGPEDATIIDIEQNSKVLTSVSVGSSTVTVEYV